MPVLLTENLKIDYTEDGKGKTVILIHSSVSGNRQWRSLVENLIDRFHVLAINLYGYGETMPWPDDSTQTLSDQAKLVLALCSKMQAPISIVGHSFGGSVALKVASFLGCQVDKMVLLEPNPFYLLKQHNRIDAYQESQEMFDHVKKYGANDDWIKVAEKFADYFVSDGTWESMSEKRRQAFVTSLAPNFYEWDATMNAKTSINEWKEIEAKTLVVSALKTRRAFREIVELFSATCYHWSFTQIPEGGHMAPLTHPDQINPVIRQFLEAPT